MDCFDLLATLHPRRIALFFLTDSGDVKPSASRRCISKDKASCLKVRMLVEFSPSGDLKNRSCWDGIT